jgi:hypothetical protein
MAIYDPHQPCWKRNLAGILDFTLAAAVFGSVLFYFFAKPFPVAHPEVIGGKKEIWSITPPITLALIALIFAYFIVLGRTGGTVFQHLFSMERAR